MTQDGAAPQAPVAPRCPACQATIPQIEWNVQGPVGVTPQGPPSIFVAFYCPACHVVLNCQLIPMLAQPPARPPVVIPGQRFR
jgi:hypothetical protein